MGNSTVYIVDGDGEVRTQVTEYLRPIGLDVVGADSAEAFLRRLPETGAAPCCLVTDIRLPGMSGIGLIEELKRQQHSLPAIVQTGLANVALAVQMMKSGVFDLIEKPVHRQILAERVQAALDFDATQKQQQADRHAMGRRLAELSPREREVLDLIIQAQSMKEIAAAMHISVKTVAKHRAKVFQKLEVATLVDLVRLAGPTLHDGAPPR